MKKPVENNIESASEDESSSSSSSPGKVVPFQSKFHVKVLNAVKDGETLEFTFTVQKLQEEPVDILRCYEDIEWLHHCLITQSDISGLVVPPLPPRPEIDPKSAETKSKRQLGTSTKVLMGDEFPKDCRNIEKYLKLVLCHEVFGNDHSLVKFLSEKEPPTRARVRKGIINKLSSAVDEARKGNHKDIDEYFQKTRDWANNYSTLMRETSQNFNKMVYAQLRLSGSCIHLSTALSQTGVYKDPATIQVNRIFGQLSTFLEDTKYGLEVLSSNDELTLGFQLELYTRYMDSVKEMLFRRTCLLVDYEDANRNLDRAKPQKRGMAEEAKVQAEKAYDECTDVARRELKSFLKQRLFSFQESLSSFAESQIRTARDTYTLLAKHLRALKELPN